MSASGAGGSRVRRIFERAQNADSIAQVIFWMISGTFIAVGTALWTGILTVADVFIIPLSQVGPALGGIVDGFFGSIGRILQLGGLSSALAVGPGGRFGGVIGFWVAILIVGFAAYVAVAIVSEEETTNFFPFIGTGWDIPTPGWTDAEEEQEG